jgi:hypothetical protein
VAHNKKVLSVESATIGGTDAEAALTGGQLLPEEQAPVDETQSEGTAA